MQFDIVLYKSIMLKQIAELFYNTIHTSCSKDYTHAQLHAWTKGKCNPSFWEKRLALSKPFVALSEAKVVGFVEFFQNDYIDCFYVHHKYQNRGVATALLQEVFKKAYSKKLKQLHVDASITAKPFFLKHGFVEIQKNLIRRENEELINYSLEKIL